MQDQEVTRIADDPHGEDWLLLLRIPPRAVVLAVLVWLAVVWVVFVAADILRLVDLGRPLWQQLFNNRPVEWTQWLLLAWAVVASAYLAGRLRSPSRAMASRFFALLAIGLGLMLIEEAGDVRHVISAGARSAFGTEILGLPHRVVCEVPYFAALAAVPVYAVLRYGRYAWESVRTRFYLASGVILYALVAIGSGIRTLGDLYIRVGAWVDRIVLGGRFPVPDGYTQASAHFQLVDGVIEESVELLAATMMLAAILSYAGWVHSHGQKCEQ